MIQFPRFTNDLRDDMLNVRTVTASVAGVVLVACVAASVAVERGKDDFGVRELYPTAQQGLSWTSTWDEDRTFTQDDPVDPWTDTRYTIGSFTARDGRLSVSGSTVRMYVHDPTLRRSWGNVEVTMYFQRTGDTGPDYSGMVSVVHTNHGTTGDVSSNLCDSRGLGARVRYDGRVDFEKETSHPSNDASSEVVVWPDGLPFNTWIGYKHVVYDVPNGTRQELWLDKEANGRWELVNSVTDTGGWWGNESCGTGVDATLPLRSGDDRLGSESGKPNVSVYFRADDVSDNGLVYKWGSIREVAVP